MKNILAAWNNKNIWMIILLAITIGASLIKYNRPLKSFDQGPARYTHYNNYIIFKQSFFHLIENKNIYDFYPEEHHDLYKYSPAFALVFGLFTLMPDWLGLLFWNAFNALIFFWVLAEKKALWIHRLPLLLLFLLIPLISSIQNSQSNPLMTALMLYTYLALEKNKPYQASIAITIATFIKIYAGLGALIFLFYPSKWKFILGGIISSLILFFIPLIALSPTNLYNQYINWAVLLQSDYDASVGVSLMQLVDVFIRDFQYKTELQLAGILSLFLLLIPLSKYKLALSRLNFMALLLIALVLFNHKSESATFIVALTGIGIWFFSILSPSKIEMGLMISVILFSVLISTGIYPPFIQKNILDPYVVKVIPVLLIYLYTGLHLMGAFQTKHLQKEIF